jgi:aldehyde dehydrogenase (NAD(P)+)
VLWEDRHVHVDEIGEALSRLDERKTWWAQLPIKDKVQYLREVRQLTLENAERWVEAGRRAKGLAPASPLVGAEEWLAGPYAVVGWITASIETLQALDSGADPLADVKTWTRPDGTVVARVLPVHVFERLLFNGIEAQVWMQPGVTEANLRENMASFYREEDPEGRVALVLGAGNVAAIVPLDILDRMINRGDVVICKMNPVNEYLGPVFEDIFAPLIRDGYVRIVYGGGDLGEYLTKHELVEAIHITGSAATHDSIVYGGGEDGARRKAADERVIDKPISSELGGVGATIVLPGPWSDADVAYQAEHLATQKLHNSGHNCIANQVVVLPSEWDGANTLLAALREQLTRAETRDAYYPGTEDRLQALRDAGPGAEALGSRLLVTGIDASADHPAFREEVFGPAMATTSLPGDSAEFLRAAVDFANDRLYGTLSVNLIVHPETARQLADELDRAIARLRFGGIGINVWAGAAFLLARAAWGAFPGHTYTDVQSGIGVVHNALMFDRPQKTVVSARFRPFPRSVVHGELTLLPKPPWFLTNKTSQATARRLTEFAADPNAKRLPALFASALRG